MDPTRSASSSTVPLEGAGARTEFPDTTPPMIVLATVVVLPAPGGASSTQMHSRTCWSDLIASFCSCLSPQSWSAYAMNRSKASRSSTVRSRVGRVLGLYGSLKIARASLIVSFPNAGWQNRLMAASSRSDDRASILTLSLVGVRDWVGRRSSSVKAPFGHLAPAGFLVWTQKCVDVAMHSSSLSTTYQCHHFAEASFLQTCWWWEVSSTVKETLVPSGGASTVPVWAEPASTGASTTISISSVGTLVLGSIEEISEDASTSIFVEASASLRPANASKGLLLGCPERFAAPVGLPVRRLGSTGHNGRRTWQLPRLR